MANEINKKTIIEEIDYPDEFIDFIALNDDVDISDELKHKIQCAPKGELLKVVKSIGSFPIKIESVDIYNEEFLLNNF